MSTSSCFMYEIVVMICLLGVLGLRYLMEEVVGTHSCVCLS